MLKLKLTLAMAAIAAFAGTASAQDSTDAARGAEIFAGACAGCHRPAGEGIPAVFPPLAGHAGELLATEGGRQYLTEVLLFGVTGPIEVDGQPYNGSMPSFGNRTDADLAALMNHLATAWGNDAITGPDFVPLTAEEVAAVRATPLTAVDVHARRAELVGGDAAAAAPVAAAAAPVTGWFTAGQATVGQQQFAQNCASCHGDSLEGRIDGPTLRGDTFLAYWGSRNVAELFAFVKNNMPPSRPASLPDQTYINIIAFILQGNGHEAGANELTPDAATLAQLPIGLSD